MKTYTIDRTVLIGNGGAPITTYTTSESAGYLAPPTSAEALRAAAEPMPVAGGTNEPVSQYQTVSWVPSKNP